MEINLILTAQTWQLASQLDRTKPFGGVMLVKNVPERTYLAVTPKQWQVLSKFSDKHTVPQVLEAIISERLCPALGEFHELMLKAVRAKILVEPNQTVATVAAVNWRLSVEPARVRYAVLALFFIGLGFTIALRPALPLTLMDGAVSIAILLLAAVLGVALSSSLLRGAGGEVYTHRRWLVSNVDACMLSKEDQRLVAIGPLATLAAATGFLTWNHPQWSFFPLLGLLVVLRPVLSGRVSAMIRTQAARRLSDAEHNFIFPPNRTPRVRWRLLRAGLQSPTTWLEIIYGTVWTLALSYFVGVLTDVPPWEIAFWKTQGPRLAVGVLSSLLLLGAIYLVSEFYLFASERAIVHRNAVRLWWRRWFGRKGQLTDESARLRAVVRSPLLRMLHPSVQRALAKVLEPQQVGPWKALHEGAEAEAQVSLILSGKVGVYRKQRTGRRILVQVLCEDELAGLHATADPEHPEFFYRSLTPVLLLRLSRADVEEHVISQMSITTLANQVVKLPFLARIRLCQNWHMQAVQRCAELSRIVNYHDNEIILQSGYFSESFFIIFEGEARISSQGQLRGVIRAGDFFGEIGLLQNSNATAQVAACIGTRCLCIPRLEFLRFVAHNYTVALELERVSSDRLGHPIFPLSPGNFQTL